MSCLLNLLPGCLLNRLPAGTAGTTTEETHFSFQIKGEEHDFKDDINEFSPALDYGAIDKPFNWRLKHFLLGQYISLSIGHIVMVQAGSYVTKMLPMPGQQHYEAMLNAYNKTITDIAIKMFNPQSLNDAMFKKLHGSGDSFEQQEALDQVQGHHQGCEK